MNHITVTRSNPRYSTLHPCSNHTIFLDGTTWKTVIHYFYGKKLSDGRLIYQILLAKTPDDARAIVASAAEDRRVKWTPETGYDVLRVALQAKVLQHAKVRNALLRTAAASFSFDLDGCGEWASDPEFAGGELLAKVLTDIRAELTKDGPFDELKDPMLPPWMKFPDIHPYDIGWRMGAGEGYLCQFNPWYNGLTPEGRKKYKEMYPPPKGWR